MHTQPAWDIYGNAGETPRFVVVVDNTRPSLTLSVESDTFSPNGDGNQDTITITQRNSTVEDEWRAEIRNAAGVAVRSFRWAGAAEDVVWDGTDETEANVPDGTFSYQVSATDRAGNSASLALNEIHMDTRSGAATISVSPSSFSPNGDGVSDETFLQPRAENPSSVERWEITIRDAAGSPRRALSGRGTPPERLAFDGRDEAGMRLPDGSYMARLELWYRYGDNPSALSPIITVDTVAPTATVDAGKALFSPEERETLVPLSLQRAIVVKQALVDRGIAADRMSTAGHGGLRPAVPHSDLANRWKNRRVEFVLVRR